MSENKTHAFGTNHQWKTMGVDMKYNGMWVYKCIDCGADHEKGVGDTEDTLEEDMKMSIDCGTLAKECVRK